MAAAASGPSFPRPVLIGAGALLAFTVVIAATARFTGVATPIPVARLVAERSLRFQDEPGGGVAVTDAATGRLVTTITGQAGFLRATMRGLAQQREREGLGEATPFRLTAWSDQRLTLDDPATGRHVELEAFGETNEAAFARLLEVRETSP